MDQFPEPKNRNPGNLVILQQQQKKQTPRVVKGQAQAWETSRLFLCVGIPAGPSAVLAGFSVCNALQISGLASDSSDISELRLTSASYLKAW